jgi:hypothetical protein
MAMTFSPRLETMLAKWEAQIKATPLPKLTDADRERIQWVRRAQAATDAVRSGDPLTADRYVSYYVKRRPMSA